jgi:hypothetical protein
LPFSTVTDIGTLAAEDDDLRLTATLEPDAALSVTVPVEFDPPITLDGENVRLLSDCPNAPTARSDTVATNNTRVMRRPSLFASQRQLLIFISSVPNSL